MTENEKLPVRRDLCVPCAARVAMAFAVKMKVNKGKITCAECGKRRYGAEYEISRKKE